MHVDIVQHSTTSNSDSCDMHTSREQHSTTRNTVSFTCTLLLYSTVQPAMLIPVTCTVREQHSTTSNAGCVPPDLVWGGLAVLPRGAPKPPNIAQGRPILNIVVYCVARQSQVPAVSLSFLDGNRTVTVQRSTTSNKENHRTKYAFLSKSHFTD
jgi:hypothetical protein